MMALALALAVLAGARAAAAHEFWIEPLDYTPRLGAHVIAALKVGQQMSGSDFPYLQHRFHSFTSTTRDGTRSVQGIDGDSPALDYQAKTAGLHVVAYHSVADLAHYDAWEEFSRYLAKEGLTGIAAAHRARGLPESGFDESYTRYAKSLIQIGPAGPADADRALGLALELVAGVNPYARPLRVMPVTLLWQGAPRAGVTVSVFRRAASVERTVLVTDASGRAEIDVAAGGEYLVNAVHMEPVEGAGAVWHSHWASLTFRVAHR